ncbi:peroxidase family protein [Nitratireductor sp. XY-223]|uniref:peroxidase family protein n=1 Tax=Nitratireductor sp. XY-223 TaxID=2561926 RepID=UPI0010AAC6C4|nr:peroxidase family protein [Nitratireductor sp. XY-223]
MRHRGQGERDSQNRRRRDDDPNEPDILVTAVRPIDGTGTVEENTDWGAAGQTLLRLADVRFEDGIGTPVEGLPSAREISNAVAQQTGDEPNSFGVSDLFWAWGQFIDHDLDLTEAGDSEAFPISVPTGDPLFDPDGTGEATIDFFRADPVEGTGETTPRQYENAITAFLDASMVYGSDAETAASLRGEGGTLLLDAQDLLVQPSENSVLAGDIRAAENVALTSLHTLFAREHNRIVDELAAADPGLSDDDLFNAARQRVEAEIQAITFNEFLPVLLGEDAITEYEGYDPNVNPGITVEFSTAAYRFGHSLLSSQIQRLNEDGSVIEAGNLELRDAYFSPYLIAEFGGIDPILRGLADSTAQELDVQVIEDVRSFLFGAPGSGGLDLASLNIQRGRDLGVAAYNDLREALGLERAQDFSDITSDADLAARLEELYGDVDAVDAWIGGLAEDPHGSGMVGELFATVITDQFLRLRDGDPFWSEGSELPQRELDALWDTTLADVIEANTDIEFIQDNALISYDRTGGTDDDEQMSGSDASDLLLGMAGDDVLEGLEGKDQLEGGEGADNLAGGSGDDNLQGGRGDDTLNGGEGNDLMSGGAGYDTFIFEGIFGDDTITDFNTGRKSDTLVFDSDLFETTEALFDAAIQDGRNVVIDAGDQGSLVLEDVDLANLRQDDVLIG